jgi:hypothetical protein
MMRGSGRESKNVSGPVFGKEPLRLGGEWRSLEGRGGTGGSEVLNIRLGMVAKDSMEWGGRIERLSRMRRIVK